ncbi:Hydroxyacyl-thioester dehydratase type 2, mitochondrial [Ceratobasidium sp. AG-Ba]|nr:Hydroxyacyl-thioester dehydratase type 2, mitochondrial [Ceratobasidium sp. AG-Ba]QRW04276.1 Hydroxyacyl-thioester dehydratase type 2, mitochondrial [Ceratobasidium sp. AG-Ba]
MTTTTPPRDQTDVIDPHKLQLLDLTLPPFDENAPSLPPPPNIDDPIVPGTELTFFPPLVRTAHLLPDGTDTTYSSPTPFYRRMWAGGAFAFDPENPLRVGQLITCKTNIEDVELKNWEKARETGELSGDTMVFVKQRREISNDNGLAVIERRTHVYRPDFSRLQSSEVTGKKKGIMHSGMVLVDPPGLYTYCLLSFRSTSAR